jgi:hypothetical protein
VYRRADVLWRRTFDRVVILVPASGEFLTLQATANALWAALEAPASLGEVAERLAAIYGAPIEQITSDIEPALQELRRRGAVAVSAPG